MQNCNEVKPQRFLKYAHQRQEPNLGQKRQFQVVPKWKGKVAAEEGGGLWILGGIGSGNGLRVGDHLRIIHDNVIKDKAGKEVYRKPIEIGSMEVTDVSQPDHADQGKQKTIESGLPCNSYELLHYGFNTIYWQNFIIIN